TCAATSLKSISPSLRNGVVIGGMTPVGRIFMDRALVFPLRPARDRSAGDFFGQLQAYRVSSVRSSGSDRLLPLPIGATHNEKPPCRDDCVPIYSLYLNPKAGVGTYRRGGRPAGGFHEPLA